MTLPAIETKRHSEAAEGEASQSESGTWPLRCSVNGEAVELDIDPRETIYDTLRERLRLTGTKGACLEGECGSCTILVDGEPVNSCLLLAPQVQGRALTTIEGLAQGDRLHAVQKHFVECGAVQCGYCTPGLVIAACALLQQQPEPSAEQIRHGLAGNICRCTGYVKIVDAVLSAAKELEEQDGR